MRKLSVILLLGITLFSCTKVLERKEYAAFVTNPENGLRKDQKLGSFELSVMYEPTDYIIQKEFKEGADNSKIENRKNELDGYDHFQFRIKLIQGGNILKYQESYEQNESTRVQHFCFEAKNDFSIVTGKDTSYCKIAQYSRNYNLTPTIDLSLTFDKLDKSENLLFVYDDKQFSIGRVKFLFDKEDIRDLPELNI